MISTSLSQPVGVSFQIDRTTHRFLETVAHLRGCDIGCALNTTLKIGMNNLLHLYQADT